MNASVPHYLLALETGGPNGPAWWRFAIRNPDGTTRFEASDVEPEAIGQRLELLTAVRGLEALDTPARVTLVGCSRYIRNGMEYGLPEWRQNEWRWEFFGQFVAVKNADLWQRFDRAMRYHQIVCQQRRLDSRHDEPPRAPLSRRVERSIETVRDKVSHCVACVAAFLAGRWPSLAPVLALEDGCSAARRAALAFPTRSVMGFKAAS